MAADARVPSTQLVPKAAVAVVMGALRVRPQWEGVEVEEVEVEVVAIGACMMVTVLGWEGGWWLGEWKWWGLEAGSGSGLEDGSGSGEAQPKWCLRGG